MPRVGPLIKTIVDTIPNGIYLRATSQEANISLDDMDLEGKILVLYNNLPNVTNTIAESGHVISVWPVELQILKLADFDDDDVDGDLLRDDCLRIAEYIIDVFPHSNTEAIEDYSVEMADNFKLYDKTMTGVMLSFDAPLDREVYCNDLNPIP